MDAFARDLLAVFAAHASQTFAWCVSDSPVYHGYVARWTDWTWSTASEYLAQTDPDEAKRVWRDYPLGDYGKSWDDPAM